VLHDARFMTHRRPAVLYETRFIVHRRPAVLHETRFIVHGRPAVLHETRFIVHGRRAVLHETRFIAHGRRAVVSEKGALAQALPVSCQGVRFGPLVLGAAVLLGVPGSARAQAPSASAPPPAIRLNRYSAYERQTLDDALDYLHTREDRSPEGKTVEGIDILTLEVFERRDLVAPGVFTFFNVFHTTTKHYVIDREVLLRPGHPYRQALVDDTIRNLRGLQQLSLVLTMATEGTTPDTVRLVVITKDVWSLRPNWNLQLTSGGLQSLSAQPAETNVAGTHQVAYLTFLYQPNSLLLGAGYTNPRVQGTRIEVAPQANIILNLPTGNPEGTTGGVLAGQPLYSPLTEWAWDAQTTWQDQIQRRYVNASLSQGSYVDPATGKSLPFAFRVLQFNTQYTLTRSFGWTTKHDITIGASLVRSGYPTTPQELLGSLPPGTYDLQTEKDFISKEVPVGDNRVGPFVQYHTYSKRYARLLDFDTLGLQEDFRLGHDVYLNVYPVTTGLGSSRNFVGFDGAASYTVQMGDALARVAVEGIAEVQTSSACPLHPFSTTVIPGPVCDSSIEPALHVVSPTAFIGRFVFDAHLVYRPTNYLNQIELLGGDTRLRGYPSGYFYGSNVLDGNLEFRTRSVDIFSVQVGLVGFYDVGDAFNSFGPGLCRATGPKMDLSLPTSFCPYQSLGTGLRILFPQLDRVVFRGDIGFPIGNGHGLPEVSPVSFFVTLGQAFTTPVVTPSTGTGTTVSDPGLSGSPSTAIAAPP
jgi:hypothetical protein